MQPRSTSPTPAVSSHATHTGAAPVSSHTGAPGSHPVSWAPWASSRQATQRVPATSHTGPLGLPAQSSSARHSTHVFVAASQACVPGQSASTKQATQTGAAPLRSHRPVGSAHPKSVSPSPAESSQATHTSAPAPSTMHTGASASQPVSCSATASSRQATHTWAVASHAPPGQSASARHPTHAGVAPLRSHTPAGAAHPKSTPPGAALSSHATQVALPDAFASHTGAAWPHPASWPPWAVSRHATQVFAAVSHTGAPAAPVQSLSLRHSTHALDWGSQTPPAGLPAQSPSPRHSTQVLDSGSQTPFAQSSSPRHPTHVFVAPSQTAPPGSPAQSSFTRQGTHVGTAPLRSHAPLGTAHPKSVPPAGAESSQATHTGLAPVASHTGFAASQPASCPPETSSRQATQVFVVASHTPPPQSASTRHSTQPAPPGVTAQRPAGSAQWKSVWPGPAVSSQATHTGLAPVASHTGFAASQPASCPPETSSRQSTQVFVAVSHTSAGAPVQSASTTQATHTGLGPLVSQVPAGAAHPKSTPPAAAVSSQATHTGAAPDSSHTGFAASQPWSWPPATSSRHARQVDEAVSHTPLGQSPSPRHWTQVFVLGSHTSPAGLPAQSPSPRHSTQTSFVVSHTPSWQSTSLLAQLGTVVAQLQIVMGCVKSSVRNTRETPSPRTISTWSRPETARKSMVMQGFGSSIATPSVQQLIQCQLPVTTPVAASYVASPGSSDCTSVPPVAPVMIACTSPPPPPASSKIMPNPRTPLGSRWRKMDAVFALSRGPLNWAEA